MADADLEEVSIRSLANMSDLTSSHRYAKPALPNSSSNPVQAAKTTNSSNSNSAYIENVVLPALIVSKGP